MADTETKEATGEAVAPTVTLGKHAATLEEPSALLSEALGRTKAEIERDGKAMTLAFGAAALYGSWPESVSWPVRPRPKPWRPGLNVAEYGQNIYDALRKATRATTSRAVLNNACIDAHNWAVECGMDAAEIREARDFSEAPGED